MAAVSVPRIAVSIVIALLALLAGDAPPAAAEKPAKGRVLIATRQVAGPPFGEAVLLLLEYGPRGALGLILNRPLSASLAELLPDVSELAGREQKAHFGGPVEPNRVWVLLLAASAPESAEALGGGLYATTSLDALRTAASDPKGQFRCYVGYAGWAPGQLDAEIARGDWLVDALEPDRVFEAAPGDLWPELIERNSGLQVRLSPTQVSAPTFR